MKPALAICVALAIVNCVEDNYQVDGSGNYIISKDELFKIANNSAKYLVNDLLVFKDEKEMEGN